MTGCATARGRRLMSWFIRTVCESGIGGRQRRKRGGQQQGRQQLFLLRCLLLLLFLLPRSALAQNPFAISGGPVLTPYGTPASNAPMRVCLVTSLGTPCSTAGVTLYSDPALTQPTSNPTNLNAQGVFTAFTTLGNYIVQIQASPPPALPYIYYVFQQGAGGSGVIIPSAQMSMFYQPNAGSSATAQGDPNATTDGSGHVQFISSATKRSPEFSVTSYGAVGDCSVNGSTAGCTDNCTTIQAAINAAHAVGVNILLANNPLLTNTPTIYYSSCTLNPKGVSIRAPVGSGQRNFSNFWPMVGVRGAPGLDVFALGDPTSGGYVSPNTTFHWEDFGIIVDDSVDVSATIAGGHRKPGKTCLDVTATLGSATLTSTNTQCAFNPGDVGQNISLTDGTNTLTTTILSVPTDTATGAGVKTAVMNTTWPYTTHTNSTLYIAIMNQSLAQRVGNVALAYDDTTNAGTNSPNQALFKNMDIVTTSQSSQTNNSGAFFFQGLAGYVYATNFENNFVRTVWGVTSVGADGTSLAHANIAWGDNNIFNNNFMETSYPWVTYGGKRTHWHGGQMAFTCWAPQILEFQSANSGSTVGLWEIDRMEYEITSGCSPSVDGGWRIEGTDHKITNSQISDATVNTPTQWDAFASSCENCFTSGSINLTGWLNRFEFVDQPYSITLTDTGFGNLCSLGRASNPAAGEEAALWRSCGAVNSRQNIAFAHTADFVGNGNELTPYSNQADLWIWPPDMFTTNGVNLHSLIVADANSESGSHMVVASTTAYGSLNGTALTFGPTQNGPNIPLTKVHVCIKWKLESGSGNDTFQLRANNITVGSVTTSLTTSYTTSCFDVDLTGLSGQTPTLVVSPAAGTTDWAWQSIHPWSDSENVNGPVNATAYLLNGIAEGSANGLPGPLDGSGFMPSAQLPVGSASQLGVLQCGSGLVCTAGVASAIAAGPVATVPTATYSGTTGPGVTTFYTTPNDGVTHQYLMCGFVIVTVAAGGGTFASQAQMTIGGSVRGFYLGQSSGGGASLTTIGNTANGAGNYSCQSFIADPNTAVKWSLTMASQSGATPTLEYAYALSVLQ